MTIDWIFSRSLTEQPEIHRLDEKLLSSQLGLHATLAIGVILERVSAAMRVRGSGLNFVEDTTAVILGFMPRIHRSKTAQACC